MDAAQRRRLGENGLVVALDPRTKRLLLYEEVGPHLVCLPGQADAVSAQGEPVQPGAAYPAGRAVLWLPTPSCALHRLCKSSGGCNMMEGPQHVHPSWEHLELCCVTRNASA